MYFIRNQRKIIKKQRKLLEKTTWYRWWDSNPHGFPYDFESYASASSATSAFRKIYYHIFLDLSILFLKVVQKFIIHCQ